MEREELINITNDLIRFQSTKDRPDEIKKCLQYIKEYFANEKVEVEEFEQNGKPSLYFSYDGNRSPTIILNGHIDVVEAEPEQFVPRLEGDKLFGRGSVDMKAGVALFMQAFKSFAKVMPSLGLMIVSDEEIGGCNCSKFLAEKQNFNPQVIIASEPNQSKTPEEMDVTLMQKGVLWVKFISSGVAAHGSRPWLGENAADLLIGAYQEVKNLFPPSSAQDHWQETINLGTFTVDNSPNRVPDKAELVVDIRFPDSITSKELLGKIDCVLTNHPTVSYEVIEDEPMLLNKADDPFLLSFKELAEKVTGKPSRLLNECGSSDLRFFSAKGITGINCGPHGKNYHGKDEWVSVKSMLLYAHVLQEYIKRHAM
ncbi:MAG: M20/M25/M40 family metallo-hydrolase [Candidatus Woesearchaeota archaeon]|nr:MAG: M20/M25/M40 family metallo-hydrolase [Candidatus Woesearchaeota archaeon]